MNIFVWMMFLGPAVQTTRRFPLLLPEVGSTRDMANDMLTEVV